MKVDKAKFKKVLKDKGLLMKDLSDYLGITRETLTNKLHGRTQFKLSELNKICFLLNIELNEIFLS